DVAAIEVEEQRRVVDDAAAIDGDTWVASTVVRVVREDVDRAGVTPGLAVPRPVVAVLTLAVVRVVVVRARDVATGRNRCEPGLVHRPPGAVAIRLVVRRARNSAGAGYRGRGAAARLVVTRLGYAGDVRAAYDRRRLV